MVKARARLETPFQSLRASSGSYLSSGSSIEAMSPSETAMPTAIATKVLAIDQEVKRLSAVRPYWYFSTSTLPSLMTSRVLEIACLTKVGSMRRFRT